MKYLLAIIVFLSGIVFIEPAPVDLLVIAVAVLLLASQGCLIGTRTTGSVFAVGDEQIDPVLSLKRGINLTDGLASGFPDDVAGKKYFHITYNPFAGYPGFITLLQTSFLCSL